MMPIYKFIHLLVAVAFFGGLIGSYFYSTSVSDSKTQQFILQKTIKIEQYLFIPMVIVAMLTGTLLVGYSPFDFTTPWIIAAYSALTLIFVLLLCAIQMKKKRMLNRIYHLTYSVMIFLLIVIVHDAVMKHTFFEYYFK